MPNVQQHLTIVGHPLLAHSLTVLRDRTTGTGDFRRHAAIASRILLMEATRDLALEPLSIQTPLTATEGHRIAGKVVLVPVLRAGLAMLHAAQEFMPWASVGFIGLERDEATAVASTYYRKFPQGLADRQVMVVDPMLATGGSMADTLDALKVQGATNIRAVVIVAAPEGVARLAETHPEVSIVTAALDAHLDERKYIVPGLGDFGDRYFET